MAKPPAGTAATKDFYEKQGWLELDGMAVDIDLFGVKEDGPIRRELYRLHTSRIRSAIAKVGEQDLRLLECGCGGSPAIKLLDLCSSYTGIDFSIRGLEMARRKLDATGVTYEVREADACNLPFQDNTFDAVYCANMIYHIEDPGAQQAALEQILRVTRVGGVVVLITANPRPLLFPVRLIRRILADSAICGSLLRRLRPNPPVPYKPMPLGWMRRVLSRWGSVEIVSSGVPSTAFNQRVTEYKGFGRIGWKLVRWIDATFPYGSAYLGNYVQITIRKAGVPPR